MARLTYQEEDQIRSRADMEGDARAHALLDEIDALREELASAQAKIRLLSQMLKE